MPNATTRPKRTRRHRRAHREETARNELVSRSLESAQQCLFSEDYGTAFVHYLLALNVAPALKDFANESFRFTLFKWAEELDTLGRIQDLFECYEQAMELFPGDEIIVNSMGEHLFRMGFRDEAAGHFYKALKLRPDFPEAKENFYRVANWLVERWHFLMLNDHGRNHKYQLAIKKAVEGGCSSVLDIGTGTGILGMCAKMAGAAEVYACELSKTMYELACEVLSANGMEDSIKILHLKSLDMKIPKDIPNRVSLVVTETVDAGLFGEGIIETLIHAWKHLLLPPPNTIEPLSSPSHTGRVIPAGATVFGVAVQCHEIRRNHRLCVSSLGGLDLSAVGQIYSPVSCLSETEDSTEPYTTERLNRLRGGYIQLTQPFTALDIDFNNVQELEGLCSREVVQLRLRVNQDGVLDALAVWFQLHLDKDNHLSTGPQEETCWEQAIYPVQSTFIPSVCLLREVDKQSNFSSVFGAQSSIRLQADSRVSVNNASRNSGDTKAPYCLQQYLKQHEGQKLITFNLLDTVKCDDEILVDISCKDSYLMLCCVAIVRDGQTIQIDNVTKGPPKTVSANPEADLCSALAGLQTNQEKLSLTFMLESSEIALLNNTAYHASFQRAMSKLLDSLKSTRRPQESNGELDPVFVLDVSEGFSLLSLIAAQLGFDKQIGSNSGLVKAYSSVEKEHHQALLKVLAKGNGVLESALAFWLSHVEDDSAVLQRPATEKLWSAIILDCIETCGLIRQKLLEKASLARCLLEDGGQIFPERIVIHGMLVESDKLLLENAVQGTEPTLGLNIAPFINQFTVPVHMFLDLSTLECTQLSEPVELFTLDLMNSSANYTDKQVKVQVSTSGKVTAIPFWYQIHLDSSQSFSTFSRDSHWKQAAVVLQQPLTVNSGDWIQLSIRLHKSSISIKAVKDEPTDDHMTTDS